MLSKSLVISCSLGSPQLVKNLLDAGADPNCNSRHWGPVHSAAYGGNVEIMRYFGSYFVSCSIFIKSRGSSIGIALGYDLDDRDSRVRFPAGAGELPLYHRVQNGSGAHPASYTVGTGGSFTGDKATGA
jgi:ankyrin repeat protein